MVFFLDCTRGVVIKNIQNLLWKEINLGAADQGPNSETEDQGPRKTNTH